jgi:LysM repeat protein
MKEGPPTGAAPPRSPWQALLGILLVVTLPTLTVLGAVLLSVQGQAASKRPAVRPAEDNPVEVIPTAAIVTPLPVTIMPSTSATDNLQMTGTHLPTNPTIGPEPSIAPFTITDVTPTAGASGTTWFTPSATPVRCGGPPFDWALFIVKEGDTLYSLALRHGTSIQRIKSVNCLESEQINVDQQLYLPILPTMVTPITPTLTTVPSLTATLTLPAPPPPSPTTVASATATPQPTPIPADTATAIPAPTSTPQSNPTLTPEASPTADAATTPTSTARPTVDPSTTPTPEEEGTPAGPPSPTPEPSPSETPRATSQE